MIKIKTSLRQATHDHSSSFEKDGVCFKFCVSNEKRRLPILMGLITMLAASCTQPGENSTIPTCDPTMAREIAAQNIVSGARDNHLLVLINFSNVWEASPSEIRQCVVRETAPDIVLEQLTRKEFRSLQNGSLIVALIKNMDEYARPDFGGMKTLATIPFHRDGEGVVFDWSTFRID